MHTYLHIYHAHLQLILSHIYKPMHAQIIKRERGKAYGKEKEMVADSQRAAETEAAECLQLEDLTGKDAGVFVFVDGDRWRSTERWKML